MARSDEQRFDDRRDRERRIKHHDRRQLDRWDRAARRDERRFEDRRRERLWD
jgi:hypothetical protein